MNILITGGAGFIGSNLANILTEKHSVSIIDTLSRQIHGSNPSKSYLFNSLPAQCKFTKGSIKNTRLIKPLLQNADIVIHLAAETGTGQSMYQIYKYYDINVSGTAAIFDIIIKNKIKINKFILASSRAVYGEGKYICKQCGVIYPGQRNEKNLAKNVFDILCPVCDKTLTPAPTDEKSSLCPVSIYGITKQNQEEIVKFSCEKYDIPYSILRFQNVFGAGQPISNPYTGIISIFSNLVLNGLPIEVFEDGLESRDFVYIDDVVSVVKLIVENGTLDNEVVNVGTGLQTTVLDVTRKIISKINPSEKYFISKKYRVGDIRHNFADISKITSRLKYTPQVSFDEGLGRFIAWVKEQPVIKPKFTRSINEIKKYGLYK